MNIILLKRLDTLGIVSDQVSFVAIKAQKEQELCRLEIESEDGWIPVNKKNLQTIQQKRQSLEL